MLPVLGNRNSQISLFCSVSDLKKINKTICDWDFGFFFNFFPLPLPREIHKQNVLEDEPQKQEDKPEVQGQTDLPGELSMVRYRKDSHQAVP